MISLKQITYALAVEQNLHFKKAAEACAISQSALSTALSELEKQLGFQIFERNNKKVLTTPLGQQFLDKARIIKLQVNELQQMADAYKTPLSYPITMGVIPTVGPYLFPKVLPALRKQYPDFQLRIIEEQSHVLVDKVRQGEIDTAIIALPYAHDGLLAFEFWQEDFYWMTHRDDTMASREEITSSDLEYSRLMLLEEGHCLKDHALTACKLRSSEQNKTFTSTSLNMLIHMVAGKIGTTLVPEIALDQLMNNGSELRAVHLNEPGPHRRIAFIVRPNYPGVANIELLMTLFGTQLSKENRRGQAR